MILQKKQARVGSQSLSGTSGFARKLKTARGKEVVSYEKLLRKVLIFPCRKSVNDASLLLMIASRLFPHPLFSAIPPTISDFCT